MVQYLLTPLGHRGGHVALEYLTTQGPDRMIALQGSLSRFRLSEWAAVLLLQAIRVLHPYCCNQGSGAAQTANHVGEKAAGLIVTL
jgi:hypothetical protein